MKGKHDKQMIKSLLFFICCIICFTFLDKGLAFAEEVMVTASDNDTRVIPDLYNTGAVEPEGGFTVITDENIPCTINGEQTTLQGALAGDIFKINLKYKNANLNGNIVIENVDLSNYSFVVYSPDALKETDRKVSFVFNNCKMKGFSGERKGVDEISYEFNNCSFISAAGSDITFNRCRFGGGIGDRLNLFVNCYVNDCYIYNPTSQVAADGEIHVDGIQIYGNNKDNSIKTENIHFDNCRFEMPALRYPNAPKTYVNACIMLQTEFSDGDNMSFKNCYLNGGGYAMYAHGSKGTKISNITFENLHFGCASIYGRLYSDKPAQDQVKWNEDTWEDASSIYVGTVKRDQAKKETYLCVSNDSNQKRYFRAYTSSGKFYDYSIDACPTRNEALNKGMTFEDFPFDQMYTVPEYCDWVVVYEMLPTDNSTAATMKQVRFQNWTEDKSVKIADVSAANLEYELSETGTLTINGFGNMPEFTSVESIPWYSEKEKIKKIVINGVTSVSNHAFSDCVNLEEVVFPEQFETIGEAAFSGCVKLPEINLNQAKALKSIGKDAFLNCISLGKVTFPESLVSVGVNAFSVDADTYQEIRERTDVYYDGPIEKWLKISFGNPKATDVSDAKSNPMYLSGGNLYVNGSKLVTELNTQESSSTVIGKNVFAGCLSLTKVNLTGVTEIGGNAFTKTKVTGEVVIPETVKKFGTYAFCDCPLIEKIIWESANAVAMGAFGANTGLKEVVISGNASGVGNWAFRGCSSLTKVTLPDTIITILQSAFQNCSALKEINIPEGVTGIGNYAFSSCTSIEKLSLPDSVKSLGLNVFANCTNLKEIRLSAGLTNLGDSCLSNCPSLEKVELPKGLTSISKSAFNGCSSLKSIQIPTSVTEIKTRAFYKCNALSSIYFSKTECPTIATDAFGYITDASVLVYIPENATGYTENALITKIASHLYSTKVIAAASCVSPGKEQYTCLLHENCESNYEKITQTKEHQPGEPVSENVVPATSEKEGSYDEVCYCSVCKKELSREKKTTEKLTQGGCTTSNGDGQSETNQGPAMNNENVSDGSTKKVSVKGTVLKKVVNKKNKKIEVTWKKLKGVTGYEVQYSTNKDFKKGVHTKKVTGAVKVKVTIKGLKKNKKYYVRIRTYKKVGGKKYVSKWSKKKSVKISR